MINSHSIKLTLLLVTVLGMVTFFQNCSMVANHDPAPTSVQSQSEKALVILKNNCASCHGGAQPVNPPNDILDVEALISAGFIVPGQPDSSLIYTSLFANMPLGQPALAESDKLTIRSWIASLADDGTPPAVLEISGGLVFDFGSVSTGSSAGQTFTVSNSGQKSAIGLAGSGLQPPFTFTGGAFPGNGGTCGANLAPGESCTIAVTFSPSATGAFTDEIEIVYADGPAPAGQIRTARRGVKGDGTGAPVANLQLSDAPAFNFGLISVGSTGAKTFTVTNTGAATATALNAGAVAAPFRYKGGVYPGTGGTCGSSLNAGQACTVKLEFAPQASGPFTGALVIHYNGPASRSVSIDLSGTGAGGAPVYYSTVRAILDSSSCNSCHGPDWGSTYASLLAFKAGTETTPAISPGSLSSRFIARISGTVDGKPQMGVPPRGSLSLANRQTIIDWIAGGALNDPAGAPALLTISDGPAYDFGAVTVGTFEDHSFTVTNGGGTSATGITGIALAQPFAFKGGNFPGTGGTCSATLATGASCTVVVRFRPLATGLNNAVLQLNYYNGQAGVAASRAMTGTGTGAPVAVLQLSPSPAHDFGAVAVSGSADQTFTLTNAGSANATVIAPVAMAAPFGFKGGSYPGTGGTCGATLAPSATCHMVVTFSPTAAGSFSSSLALNYNNGQSSQSVSSALSGLGAGGEPVYYSEVRQILNESACNSCHSSHWGTTYSGLLAFKYPGRASAAINPGDLNSRFVQYITNPPAGKPKMGEGGYGSLTATSVEKILTWIANGAPDDPAGTITQDFRPLAGDRHYLGSVLHKVFGDNGARVRSYSRQVYERGDLFGSPCHAQELVYLSESSVGKRNQIYVGDDSCHDKMSEESTLHAETVPDSSPVSEAVRQSTCMRITEKTGNLAEALVGAGLTRNSPFTAANVSRVVERFQPGLTPSTQGVNALIGIGSAAVADPLIQTDPALPKTLEGWRFIFMSVCISPSWLSL